ncbi:MAG: ISAs1 family transposase [Candidatus Promineifilaceae bacterium]
MTDKGASLFEHFAVIADPRVEHLADHKLIDILVIAICAVICGAEDWTEVELFGKARQEWLRPFLELKNGIPFHDTFGRAFARLDAGQFQHSFASWVQAVFQATQGQVVAIDGKTARRSHDRVIGRDAIHLVSAWAAANHQVLGQKEVADKSNEITAIPQLLRLLDVQGCIVTVDAMGCQTEIAEQIIGQGADYLLTVKGNQANLLDDISLFFRLAQQNDFQKVDHTYHRTTNKGHGRVEIRQCRAISGEESLQFLRESAAWKGLRSIAMVTGERRVGQKSSIETRYYISSLPNDAQRILEAARSHWAVENELHWVLDVSLGEDHSRVRQGNGQANLALLRRMALNLLKQEKTLKRGIKAKRLKAALSPDYLLQVLRP